MKQLIILPVLFIYSIIYGQNPKKIVNIPGAPASAFFSWACNGLQFYQDYVAATNNTQLWRTDGTAAGTFPLTNFSQGDGIVNTGTDRAAVSGNIFYFTVIRSNIIELWKSDGTVNGTLQVNISPATQTAGFIIANSTHLFFSAGYPSYEDLYSVDNSGTVTYLQRLSQPYIYAFSAGSACIFRDKLITWRQSVFGTNNNQLFISDGTISGSYSDPTIFGSIGTKMIPCGDQFVLAKMPINSVTANLIKVPGISNGGIGTPVIFYTTGSGDYLNDYNYHYSSSNNTNGIETFQGNATIGNSILLSGYSDNQGWELWKTDGTSAGTVLVKDIYPGNGSGYDRWKGFVINGKFVFYAYSTSGYKLFYSDGTTAGTDFFPQISTDQFFLLNYVCYKNSKAYFPFNTTDGYPAIWETDGSINNTLPVTPSDVSPSSGIAPFGNVNNGNILYKTTDGTGLIKTIAALNPDFHLWNGFVDNNWNNPSNWNTNVVPVATNNVLIPGSVPNYPILSSGTSINSFWINGYNSTITISAPLNLTEELGTSVYNTLAGSGSIDFLGTGNHTISGGGVINIPINIIGGDAYVMSNITCKSIDAKPGTTITINPGIRLTLTGQ